MKAEDCAAWGYYYITPLPDKCQNPYQPEPQPQCREPPHKFPTLEHGEFIKS